MLTGGFLWSCAEVGSWVILAGIYGVTWKGDDCVLLTHVVFVSGLTCVDPDICGDDDMIT